MCASVWHLYWLPVLPRDDVLFLSGDFCDFGLSVDCAVCLSIDAHHHYTCIDSSFSFTWQYCVLLFRLFLLASFLAFLCVSAASSVSLMSICCAYENSFGSLSCSDWFPFANSRVFCFVFLVCLRLTCVNGSLCSPSVTDRQRDRWMVGWMDTVDIIQEIRPGGRGRGRVCLNLSPRKKTNRCDSSVPYHFHLCGRRKNEEKKEKEKKGKERKKGKGKRKKKRREEKKKRRKEGREKAKPLSILVFFLLSYLVSWSSRSNLCL